MKRNLLLFISIALLAAACDDDPASAPDAATSDTLTTADTSTPSDGKTSDAANADMLTVDSAISDAATADGPVADAGVPTKTPCGSSLQCDSVTEVCVINEAQVKTYVCKAVPKGCEQKRTCACLGATVCTGVFKLCNDTTASNTVTCSCPNC